MPNWCYNEITFNPADVAKVKALVSPDPNIEAFDLNRILPMPETLAISCGSSTQDAEEFLTTGKYDADRYPDEGEEPDPGIFVGRKELIEPHTLPELRAFAKLIQKNKRDYGAAGWYEWRCKYWGTKWNTDDVKWDKCRVFFDTAWAPPIHALEELSKKLGITFTVSAEEPDTMRYLKAKISNGKVLA